MNKIDTQLLLALLEKGNERAFSIFFDLYYDMVFKVAYFYLREKEGCKEVVSNVFFSIWKSRRNLSQIDKMEAYLYVMTKNEARHYLSTRNKIEYTSLDEIPIALESDEISADNQLIYKEIEQTIQHLINNLPEKCRIIFLLSREKGMSNKEIAENLSLTESTVRGQLKIAIDKIALQMKEKYPNLTFILLFSFLFP